MKLPGELVKETVSKDAFGELISQSGTTTNEWRYEGEQYDAGSGLYDLRARWMDPGVGRFTSRDTFSGTLTDPISLHPYLYTKDDPVDRTDPSGQDSLSQYHGLILGVLEGLFRPAKELYFLPGLKPFFAPQNTNWGIIQEMGEINGKNPIEDYLNEGPGGYYDFQRPEGKHEPFYGEFRIAANIGVGIYMEGAGYSLDEMLTEVTYFAALKSNADQTTSPFYWGYGYTFAKHGILPEPFSLKVSEF